MSIASKTSLWPGPGTGRIVQNGIEYSEHALVRMMPKGLVFKENEFMGTIGEFASRGIPPSVVENAIQYGEQTIGKQPGTIMHTYDNIKVVTDILTKRVITVMQ